MLDIYQNINTWGEGTIFKYGFLDSLIIMFIFLILALIIVKTISRYIKKKVKVNTKVALRMCRVVTYTIAIYACLTLFSPFESVLGKIWGSAGILAVVIGLAAQEAMGNFVSGMLITTFKPFKIGDLVKVNNGELVGFVVDISLRDTVIRTYENTKIVIPNSVMNKAILENVSAIGSSKANFLELDIAYDSDIDTAMRIIKEEIMAHPNFLDAREDEEIQQNVSPVITRFTSFNDSSITLRTSVYSKNNAEGFAMLSDLRISIKRRFDAEGISFPFPQRTVTIKHEDSSKG